jgi:hypothetical protein
MTPANPWCDRYPPLLQDGEIARRCIVPADPIDDLRKLPPHAAAAMLSKAIDRIFVPTVQCVAILKKFVEISWAHAMTRYPDARQFLSGCYQPEIPASLGRTMCLTGPAGVGKSKIIAAFERVLPAESVVEVGMGHSPFPLVSTWSFNIRASAGASQLLMPYAIHQNVSGKRSAGAVEHLARLVRRNAYQSGVGLITADEFQFVTHSESANTRATQYLLLLAYLGLPFVFVANYSLGHRVMKRPQEDRQRLLSEPMVLLPDPADSPDWRLALTECFRIAPNVFDIDPDKEAETIHRYTGGLMRMLRELLVIAYRVACQNGDKSVKPAHLKQAYCSLEYGINRQDVEVMTEQLISGRPGNRLDLWCPFELPAGYAAQVRQQALQERATRAAREMVLSSLTPNERRGYARVTKQKQESREQQVHPKVTRLADRHKKQTAQTLLDASRRFKEKHLRQSDRTTSRESGSESDM